MDKELTPIEKDEHFYFSCSPQIPCYTQCCRDLNQFLTPYDVLRLKQRFKITAEEFLKNFAAIQIGHDTGLPIAVLKPLHDNRRCPFVTSEGCSVYSDRPSSCRTYPIIRLVSRSRETGKLMERYFIHQEDHCAGFSSLIKGNETITLAEWIETQEITPYNHMNDLMLAVIAQKNRCCGRAMLSQSLKQLLQCACYEIEKFREMLSSNSLSQYTNHINISLLEAAQHDDLALLKVGMETAQTALFIHAR